MTLEELKKEYERSIETSEKRGQMYCNEAEDAKQKGDYETASLYYNIASTVYYEATIYKHVLNDLLKVTK